MRDKSRETDHVVHLSNLSKIYPNGTVALKHASADVQQGQFFIAVLGPSGAGKSTLLRCIGGLIAPSDGDMRIGNIQYNHSYKSLLAIRRITSLIFQEFNLFGNLTALQNVLIGRLPYLSFLSWMTRRFSVEDKEIAFRALQRVGLASKVYVKVNELSGGQKQRVGIARAIVQYPVILLADEPVASLDPKASCDILELLREICTENQRTVLCNLHQVEYGLKFSDRIIGLSDGNILIDRPTSSLNTKEIIELYGETDPHPEIMKQVCELAA